METPPPAAMNSPNRPHLRRWNTISASSIAGRNLRAAAAACRSSDDLELLPLNPASSHTYSSLKDLLPSLAAVNSPKLKATPSGSDICIRNRLVKHAARAYLAPMSPYPTSADANFFQRLCSGVAALIDFFCTKVVKILDGALRAVRIRSPGFKMCLV